MKQTSIQINALKARTGLPYTPTVYLTGTINWMLSANKKTPAAGYTEGGRKEIVIDVKYLNLPIITHEFGHLFDWYKGPDLPPTPATVPDTWKWKNNVLGTKSHAFSSDYSDFDDAFSIVKKGIISGYAATNRQEMFAEMFAAQETPDSAGGSNSTSRQGITYALTNAALGDFKDMFTYSGSMVNLPGGSDQQNAAMYIYKYVANKDGLDQVFPGTYQAGSYNQIASGQYMASGVLPIRIVNPSNVPLDGKNITIGGLSTTTRAYKASNVFPDGDGDLFDDITGTAVLIGEPIGKETISFPGIAGATFSPTSVNVVAGANPVVTITFTSTVKTISGSISSPTVAQFSGLISDTNAANYFTGFNYFVLPPTSISCPSSPTASLSSQPIKVDATPNSAGGVFTSTVSSVSDIKTYCVQAYAIPKGSTSPILGNWLKVWPALSVNGPTATSVTNSSVKLNSSISLFGGMLPTSAGFWVWQDPTNFSSGCTAFVLDTYDTTKDSGAFHDANTPSGDSPNNLFSTVVTGLKANTSYCFYSGATQKNQFLGYVPVNPPTHPYSTSPTITIYGLVGSQAGMFRTTP